MVRETDTDTDTDGGRQDGISAPPTRGGGVHSSVFKQNDLRLPARGTPAAPAPFAPGEAGSVNAAPGIACPSECIRSRDTDAEEACEPSSRDSWTARSWAKAEAGGSCSWHRRAGMFAARRRRDIEGSAHVGTSDGCAKPKPKASPSGASDGCERACGSREGPKASAPTGGSVVQGPSEGPPGSVYAALAVVGASRPRKRLFGVCG